MSRDGLFFPLTHWATHGSKFDLPRHEASALKAPGRLIKFACHANVQALLLLGLIDHGKALFDPMVYVISKVFALLHNGWKILRRNG